MNLLKSLFQSASTFYRLKPKNKTVYLGLPFVAFAASYKIDQPFEQQQQLREQQGRAGYDDSYYQQQRQRQRADAEDERANLIARPYSRLPVRGMADASDPSPSGMHTSIYALTKEEYAHLLEEGKAPMGFIVREQNSLLARPAARTPSAKGEEDIAKQGRGTPVAPTGDFGFQLRTVRRLLGDPRTTFNTNSYTARINDDISQRAIFDTEAPNAKLIGIEYVISDRLFFQLSPDEQQFWFREGAREFGKSYCLWEADKDSLPMGLPKFMVP